jgi:hypothetical protein
VLPDGAVGEKLVALFDDFADGRKVKGIEDFEARGEFPGEKKRYDPDCAEPVGEPFARPLPQPVGRQRIRFVDRYEIDGVLLCRSVSPG